MSAPDIFSDTMNDVGSILPSDGTGTWANDQANNNIFDDAGADMSANPAANAGGLDDFQEWRRQIERNGAGQTVESTTTTTYDGNDVDQIRSREISQREYDSNGMPSEPMSGGAIAGIVIMTILTAGILAFIVWWSTEVVKNNTQKNKRFVSATGLATVMTGVETSNDCVKACQNTATCGGLNYNPASKTCTLVPGPGQLVDDVDPNSNNEGWSKPTPSTMA